LSTRGCALVILGPTAVGKSAVAIAVASAITDGGEIISADSRAFFRGLDIVTDKPSRAALNEVPHHLIDIVPVDGAYDAMAFRRDVERLILQIFDHRKTPIIVGGGTLYLGAILRGIFSGPASNKRLRAALSTEPLDQLYERLQEADPTAAAAIHPNDRLRIVRALEVAITTGEPISRLQQKAQPLPYLFRVFGLRRDRDDHRSAIAARVKRMLASGLIKEVSTMREHGLTQDCQAYRTIGVRETFSYLDGKITRAELEQQIVNNTWSLARRQMAWFRRDENVTWVDVTGKSAEEVGREITSELERESAETAVPDVLRD
jgi:tRNA dimethylallyltransferase